LPVIAGELNSGKYGATFPGTLSTRDYLKVMAYDCAHLLHQRCEPLGVMASLHGRDYPAAQYEVWARALLQNAVHDCICGVSIDQVHEKMEFIYRQAFDGMLEDIQSSLEVILGGFQPGLYAISTSQFALETWISLDGHLYPIRTAGLGVWPVEESWLIESINMEVESFAWSNDHYGASVDPEGRLLINDGRYGRLMVSRENGDAYSCELGETLGMLEVVGSLILIEKSELHCVIGFTCRWQGSRGDEWVEAEVRVCFDPSPIVRWQIDVETRGAGLRVEMVFETGIWGECWAGMQFDLVKRPFFDRDLLPPQVPLNLQRILLGQRELGEVNTFPFHDLLCISDGKHARAIFARGIHAYTADETGTIKLTLRRAVEWLTRSDLQSRLGDAGPFFYVPDGRCERKVLHEVALLVGGAALPTSIELYARLAAYQNPPLIVHGQGSNKLASTWQLLHEELPLSCLVRCEDQVLARFYNPMMQSHTLNREYLETSVWGEAHGNVVEVGPKKIVTVHLEYLQNRSSSLAPIRILNPPIWRVGSNAGRPNLRILNLLEEKVAYLEKEAAACQAGLSEVHSADYLRQLHHYYVLKRESVEYQLSLLLNRRKLVELVGGPSHAYLFGADSEIAALGMELNQLRMKRRIYDYIVIS
ncbi:MAG: hypothetical protein JW726_08025, partial [Anaerolineales bacterium]|nr:hypothetical protein [Anaerolineales bacterium]